MPSRWLVQFYFEWDSAKELSNFRKHGVRFEAAITVLHDPLAMSRPDYEHDGAEERWLTIGATADGDLVVVVHTHEELNAHEVIARIISARRPTKDERFQYQSGNYRIQDKDMRDQYDFSNGVRGKFYRENAVIMGPVHLEARVLARLNALAEKKGQSPSDLVSEMLDRETGGASG